MLQSTGPLLLPHDGWGGGASSGTGERSFMTLRGARLSSLWAKLKARGAKRVERRICGSMIGWGLRDIHGGWRVL